MTAGQVDGTLAGLKVLVTRPKEQAASLSQALAREGAQPVELPLIAIQPREDDDGAIARAMCSLADYHWLVFTSVNGVDIFFSKLSSLGLNASALRGLSVAAIGPATAQALEQRGKDVAFVPKLHCTEGIVNGMKDFDLAGARVLLPRAEDGSAELPPGLEALGAQVEHLPLYRTEIPPEARTEVFDLLREGVDVATFTSPSTVRHLLEVLDGQLGLLDGVLLACIGPVTAQAARQAGLPPQVVASKHTVEGLVQALGEYYVNGRKQQW